MTEFESQVPVALLTTNVLEWLKHQKWFPFAQYGAKALNIVSASTTALIAAGALHYTFDNEGTFSLGGNIWTIAHTLWVAVVQYSLQHFFFKTTVAPPASPVLTKAEIEAKKK